jgi:hypothetical protein
LLAAVEGVIVDMMNKIYEKMRTFCNCRDIKLASFLVDDGAHVAHSGSGAKPPEKEVITRVTNSTKPFSIDKLRSMLD